MSLRFTLLSATMIFATVCSTSASSADSVAVAIAPSALPISATAAPIVLAQATTTDAVIAVAKPDGAALYTVVDKHKVDPQTLMGWKTWRAMACERCHGGAQEGLVGPSLINSLKVLTKAEFMTTLKNGRVEKGMPNFGGVPSVVANLDNLYAYLKGRSDDAIAPGRLEAISK